MNRLSLSIALLGLGLVAGCARDWDPARDAVRASRQNSDATHSMPSAPAGSPRRGLASAPDRGLLFDYDGTPTLRQSGAYTSYPVALSEAHALRAISTGEMTVPAPDGTQIRLRYERHVEHPDGNWSWIGRDAQGVDAVVTFGDKAVFGSIPYQGRPALRLTLANGRSWLVATDPGKVSDAMARAGKQDYLIPPAVVGKVMQQRDEPVSQSGAQPVAAAATATAGTVVDVVLGYTSGFAASFGGPSQAVTRLTNLVDITNQSYANSQMTAQVRLTGTVQVDYPDSTKNVTALEELTGYRSGPIAVPAALQPLRDARDQFGADVVSLVRKFRAPENEGCGIAWLLGSAGTLIDGSDAAFAYSIVSEGSDFDESNGKNYFCREETLAHEFGHSMGQTHNQEDTEKPGAHPYAYGYREAAATGFYTVMAYRLPESSQFTIRYFSNPGVAYQGRPTGTENADNARSLGQTMPIIASFRAQVVASPIRGRPRTDMNGDGRADIVWRNAAVAQTSRWYMDGPARIGGMADAMSSNYRIVGIGDFDGDGRSDLLWADGANSHLLMWRPNAAGTYVGNFVDSIPAGWSISGVADMNGDGRADIVWRNAAVAQTLRWYMDGPVRIGATADSMSSHYRIVGIGDFDGDGRSDLLWTDGGNSHLLMWRPNAAGTYVGSYVDNIPAGWSVSGVADMNGDGRADIVWRNAEVAQTSRWFMDGPVRIGGAADSMSSNYRIVGIGDFDGDGRGDLLWANVGNTHLLMWRPNAAGTYAGSYVDSIPAGWSVVNGGF